MNKLAILASLAAAAVLAGCTAQLEPVTVPAAGTVPASDNGPLTIRPDAGRALDAPGGAAATAGTPGAPGAAVPAPDIFTIARSMSFATRRDPFSLLGSEISFDRSQTAARILSESGGFREDFEPQPEVEEEQIQELVPIPDWRVSGIIISDSVLALVDTGQGVFDVRPGQAVGPTEWVVIAIDEESVLLRHRRNVTPREHRVLLSSQLLTSPAGGPGQGGPGGPGGFGPPGGPGGPGPGVPGGRNRGGAADGEGFDR